MGRDRRPTKRPVNLSLNDDLVRQARGLTANLSETVEALLAVFVETETKRRATANAEVAALIAASNHVLATHGSFGDEFSTL